ncbi:MAG: peptidylprolyl isomerase [Acidobacteriota bacterium]|nr:peptidylprolyl isomerase [Acidobacteriota bacterium]
MFLDGRAPPNGRRPGAAASPGAFLCGALMTVSGTLLLAACGSGGGSQAAAGAARGNRATASGGTSRAAGARSAVGCRTVPNPPTHAGARAAPPAAHLDRRHTYTVTLHTNCGDIVIALDVERAPITASSFASLVRQRFYDGLTFHRIVPGFVIQGGDPNGNGTGGPGYSVVEAPPSDLQYTRGVVAMAKTGADPSGTSGSQFFIVTAQNAGLPAQYALVGHIVGGEDAVEAISRVPTTTGPAGEEGAPSTPVVIESASLAIS